MTDYNKWERINSSIEDDEFDVAKEKLRMQKEQMSDTEVRRIHDCWEKPEFRAMFDEYAQEVSDPKHKAETEAYLAQCEAEQRAAAAGGLNVESIGAGGVPAAGGGVAPPAPPDGSQLLKPKKGFVVKTWKKEAGRKDFDREMGKVFVNVCQHEDIGKPESKQVTADGRRGESWSLPNLCSPAPREEKDKADHVCVVLDIVFHNEVLSRCDAPGVQGERWQQMVARTAVEQCAKHHELILDLDGFKQLKTKYYGEQVDDKGVAQGCCTMAWKPGGGFEGKEGQGAKGAAKPKGSGAKAGADAPKPPAAAPAPAAPLAPAAPPPADASTAIRTPKYTLVHRGAESADLAGAWNDARVAGGSSRPVELVLRVELPEVSSAGDVDLDITPKHLSLREECHGYELELELPYLVDEARGSAKFDKAKRLLTVVLPVVGAAEQLAAFTPASAGQSEAAAAAELAAAQAAEAASTAEAAAVEAARRARERAAREEQARAAAEAREAARTRAVAQAEREEMARAEALTRGAPPSLATASAQRALAAAEPKAAPPPAPVEGFKAAASFDGARQGEVFKLGAAGLGFYPDAAVQPPPPKPRPPPASPKEKMLMPVVAPEAEAPPASNGESSPEWVLVDKEAAGAAEGRGGGKGATETAGREGERENMPAFQNGLLFELD